MGLFRKKVTSGIYGCAMFGAAAAAVDAYVVPTTRCCCCWCCTPPLMHSYCGLSCCCVHAWQTASSTCGGLPCWRTASFTIWTTKQRLVTTALPLPFSQPCSHSPTICRFHVYGVSVKVPSRITWQTVAAPSSNSSISKQHAAHGWFQSFTCLHVFHPVSTSDDGQLKSRMVTELSLSLLSLLHPIPLQSACCSPSTIAASLHHTIAYTSLKVHVRALVFASLAACSRLLGHWSVEQSPAYPVVRSVANAAPCRNV